jgi:hypothetical protein
MREEMVEPTEKDDSYLLMFIDLTPYNYILPWTTLSLYNYIQAVFRWCKS